VKAPVTIIEKMRADAQVLALVANTDCPFTLSVIDGVANWFEDVEIKFPIMDMDLSLDEQRSIVRLASNELVNHFDDFCKIAEKENGLSESRFEELGKLVDPLWRELSGAFAKELNKRFEETRIPNEVAKRYLEDMISRFKLEQGDYAADEFINAIKFDKRLRAQLRRMGIDPDLA